MPKSKKTSAELGVMAKDKVTPYVPPAVVKEHSQQEITRNFVNALGAALEKHGPASLDELAEKNPAEFFKICAKLLPTQMTVQLEQKIPGDLPLDAWRINLRILDLIKIHTPADSVPEEVFGVIESALIQHFAKDITDGRPH